MPFLECLAMSGSFSDTFSVNFQSSEVENGKRKIRIEQMDVIGSNAGFWSPFGWQKYTYADHTASGRSLKGVEDFIEGEVLPHYANTHTTVSHTSFQTTNFRNEARQIIKQSVGGFAEDHVIFCGSGATCAVQKLVHYVSYPKSRKVIVFVGPFEHHSNILPWREKASKVVQIPVESLTGQLDLKFLEQALQKFTKRRRFKNKLLVGCFSAASNVTGIVTDDLAVTALMHKYGGLSFWDYAGAAPHMQINMNPGKTGEHGGVNKDALYFSGHKFLGGVQTPGVLIVKKHVIQNPVPHGVGGGTVLYTTRNDHEYLTDVEEREEGGTPEIVGSIRLGLTFRVRNLIGVNEIIAREAACCKKILKEWSRIPEIHILGSAKNPRLPCISFIIEHLQTGHFLHHNFVVALLNDLFGVQCRGGCMCAGPYSQILLGINDDLAEVYGKQLKQCQSQSGRCDKTVSHPHYGFMLKPGFVRISLSYHLSAEEIDFIINAVKLIASDGWRLLPFYKVCCETASFSYFTGEDIRPVSLSLIDRLILTKKNIKNDLLSSFDFSQCLKKAKTIMTGMTKNIVFKSVLLHPSCKVFEFHDPKLRWFMSQQESVLLQQRTYYPHMNVKLTRPFNPPEYDQGKSLISSPMWTEGSIPHVLDLAWKNN